MTGFPGSYVLILAYHDGSGLLGAWGPYPSRDAAIAGQQALQSWPIEQGNWTILPLFLPLAGPPSA